MKSQAKAVNGGVMIGAAALVTALAWALTVRSAQQMAGAMPMPGGWSMSMTWMAMGDQTVAARAAMFVAMWTVMMIAMMLPSVMPTVLLHRRLLASRREREDEVSGSNLLLLAGYFGVWAVFGIVAYIIGTSIAISAMHSAALSRLVPAATSLTLVAAGIYQLTSWKQVCLSHCRSPFEFFATHRISSPSDSLIFGVHHGAYCAACCWALMAIQLAIGVMSLPLMLAVALVILLEKQWKYGPSLAAVVGIASILGGGILLLKPLLLTH